MIPLRTLPLPHLHTVAVAFAARGGPRYEGEHQRAQTHFLEHMIFRGAGDLSTRELIAAFEALGGAPDACTSEDSLLIELAVDPDGLERALALLAQVLLQPRFEDIEAERSIILEERLEHMTPDGGLDLDDLERSLAFQGHPLSRSIIGRKRDIERCTTADLATWRDSLVRSAGCTLVVAGPVDAARVEQAAAPLSELPASAPLQDSGGVPPQVGRRISFQPDDGVQAQVRLSFRAPGEADPRFGQLRAMVDVLDGGPTSRLPIEIVDAGLAYDARAELFALPDVSLVELDVAVGNRKLPEAIQRLLDLASGVTQGVHAAELERGRMRRRHLRRALRDDALAQAAWTARRLLIGLHDDHEQTLAAQDAAAPSEIADLAREVFVPEGLTAVVLGDPSKATRRKAKKILEEWG